MAQAPSAPPPPSKAPPPPSTNQKPSKVFTSSKGIIKRCKRIAIYGSGGIGKTELANMLPDAKFIDTDEGTHYRENIDRVDGVETWQDLLDALRQEDLWKDAKSIVIDSATRAEILAVAHTIKTIKGPGDKFVDNIEGYGYGKGYQYVYDTFLHLFAALDRHVMQGRNVCLVCHDCQDSVDNPTGDNWKQYQPRLQSPSSGKGSVRLMLREWLDYLFFIKYDIAGAKDGKVKGAGTRTIYGAEMPDFWAKSRPAINPVPYIEGDDKLWKTIGIK